MTDNSTNNLDATICQHLQRAQALQNTDLVDKNYSLSNDLQEVHAQMAVVLAQNRLLKERLSGLPLDFSLKSANADVPMEEDNEEAVLLIRGGGYAMHSSRLDSVLFFVDDALLQDAATPTPCFPILCGWAQSSGLSSSGIC